jgi:hypothetical protein
VPGVFQPSWRICAGRFRVSVLKNTLELSRMQSSWSRLRIRPRGAVQLIERGAELLDLDPGADLKLPRELIASGGPGKQGLISKALNHKAYC